MVEYKIQHQFFKMSLKKRPKYNFGELSIIDDVAKYVVLDRYLNFEVQKMNVLNIINFLVQDNDFLRQIIQDFMAKIFDKEEALKKLESCMNFQELHIYIGDLKFLDKQILDYLSIIDPASGIKIEQSHRYKSNIMHAKVTATRDLRKNEKIDVFGVYSELNNEDEAFITSQQKDFSVIYSEKRKCSVLLLGPVALINHDCNANCSYSTNEKDEVFVVLKRKIKCGEELTCYYGKNYFDENNAVCECETCEKTCNGIFKQENKNDDYEIVSDLNNFDKYKVRYFI